MTCKNCIHENVCNKLCPKGLLPYNSDKYPAEKFCLEFKNKVDFVEVKHAEWLPDYETFIDEWERESEPTQTGWVCSLCGRQEFNRKPYCNCGAKMDSERSAE